MKRGINIPKETLADLYWNKNKKPREIAELFGIKNERTIRKKMERYGIRRKTVSEALTRKLKKTFLGNLAEKAYFLGLRAGDFHAKTVKKCVRMQTSTTHPAQIELLRDSFKEYGQTCVYKFKSKEMQYEWFIYVDLHPSFYFLLEKSTRIPDWILGDENLFFRFLAAYMDCEGNWHLSKSHETNGRFTFRLRTGDKEILEDIKEKLGSLGYKIVFGLNIKKGTPSPKGLFRKDIYALVLNKKQQVIKLIEELLPFSRHSEKIDKMNFMLKHQNSKYHGLMKDWNDIKNKIKKEILTSDK